MNLRIEHAPGLARVLIDRADKKNAMSLAMWEALPGLVARAVGDPTIRALEFTAAEPEAAFCAGADIAEMLAHKDDAAWLTRNQSAINRAQHMLTRVSVPTVAFVNGDCIGGGAGMAMACDIRVAAPSARFGVTPAKLGLVYPLHDVKLLTDLVGPGQAKRLLYTGKLIDAAEAQRIGLVEEIAESAAPMIGEILAAAPSSQSAAKAFMRRVLDGACEDDDHSLEVFAKAFSGPDFAEGASAFVGKRKPDFSYQRERDSEHEQLPKPPRPEPSE
ncbi:MAG: enoyl-CoA hydratase/isomerase family protein [Pseudomonadota bacterium]